MLASTHSYQLFRTDFTRVTELLADPRDMVAAATMFLEELTEAFNGCLDESITVLSATPITDEELTREEIEYHFIVLASPDDVRWINSDADEQFHLESLS